MSLSTLPCPHCAHGISVDAEVCPACGSHLVRRADRLLGEGAHRAVRVAELAVHVEPAPVARLRRKVQPGATLLSVRPARAPLAALLPGMTVYATLFGLWMRDAVSRPGLNLLGCIVPATMAILFVASTLWHLLGRETLRVDGERVILQRGIGVLNARQSLPRRSHIEVECTSEDVEHVVVVRRDRERLALGRAMNLDAEHADWLARAVRKAIAEGSDPQAG